MNMMSPSASSSSAKRSTKPLLHSIAVITSFMLVLPSCCIPKLCCPESGKPLPDTYNGKTDADNSAQLRWCDFFNDPTLIDLINQALAGNQELKIRNQDVRIANNEIL